MSSVSHTIDRMDVNFDDGSLVANAGLIIPATLMARLSLETLVDATVRLSGRVGGSRPGRKICTLVATILAGGSHIDHADMLRAGATRRVLPFRVMAPSTLGTFLRSFTFGHVRQLDRVSDVILGRAWRRSVGDRYGLNNLRGPRRPQTRRRVWLYETVGFTSVTRDACRQRRDPSRAST